MSLPEQIVYVSNNSCCNLAENAIGRFLVQYTPLLDENIVIPPQDSVSIANQVRFQRRIAFLARAQEIKDNVINNLTHIAVACCNSPCCSGVINAISGAGVTYVFRLSQILSDAVLGVILNNAQVDEFLDNVVAEYKRDVRKILKGLSSKCESPVVSTNLNFLRVNSQGIVETVPVGELAGRTAPK